MEKSNETDSTFVGMTMDHVRIDSSIKGYAEPWSAHVDRILIMGSALSALIVVMIVVFLFINYWCLLLLIQSKSSRAADVESVMNQGRLMSLMRNVPYSRFMLDGERDCPICLL